MFKDVENILDTLKKGKMIIIVDDEDRENEGDLMFAAEYATPELVNFMAKHGRGLICVPMSEKALKRLNIEMMTDENTSPFSTAFTVSVEAANGVTTGISAHDRAKTIKVLADPDSKPEDIVKPGHIFPLKAKKNGVLERAGQTEASVDLCRLADLEEAAVICEIMNEDGTMARMPELEKISEDFDIPIITVEKIISYRMARETTIKKVDSTRLPTEFGEFNLTGFEVLHNDEHHIAISLGSWEKDEPVLVRVHSECLTGDALHSLRCDCGKQLDYAMQKIQEEGKGIIVYMRQEGRGIGLLNKIKAYHLQDNGLDTVEANVKLGFKPDLRDYGIGAQILKAMGVGKIRLMTNNPRKIVGLEGYGLEVIETVPIIVGHNDENKRYLDTKKEKMGHMF
ncbi:MAG: bifunctional 3,4-dihydroxy-2-butanone-4-phosphate synthase/GTP cyclohydrolase II [Candidatus Muiribacterium halophilum]|uniref:Riboflavin biosynthesis protein RibBA n=1 Tax=Muiribacterium halophilum TaxID=2053465 RepID=A0A2N5ZFE0_MUIH1|nr:MAG: bifunctional 3,4-dihydroxy-2-butanone-4-phosphate synthase/GTP cyclohydrolase II [Candidatus Muirbacterium halophilum]